MSENELAVHETHDVFESYDLADEEQIIAEMSGRVTDKYVYTFKQAGQEVTGLSFAGTNWAVREYAKQGEIIRIVGRPEIIVDPTDHDYIVVVVTAQRFVVNRETGKEIPLDSTIGVKRQGKLMDKKKFGPDGEQVGYEKVVDPFYVEKAVSKAIRNAKQALIPTDIVKKLISRAIDAKNGKSIQGKGQQRQAQQPPPQQQQARPIQTPPAQQQRPPGAPAQQTPVQQAPAQQAPVQQGAPVQQSAPAQQVAVQQPVGPVMASTTAGAQQQAPVQTPPPVTPPVHVATAQPVQAPPQQQAPPVQQAPVQQPAPGAPAAAEPNKDVMVQKLDAVLKAVFATQDTTVSRQGLAVLTGFASPADMPVDQIRGLGNILNQVVKKQARVNGNQIVRLSDNVVIWQGPPMANAPAAGSEPMF